MKRIVSLLLTLCLLCAFGSALASGLPDLSGGNAAASADLPNPGSFYGVKETLFQNGFVYTDGLTYDVYTFPLVDDWGNLTSQFIQACEARQLSWSVEKLEENTAYRIKGASGQALLVPNYQGQIMLMKTADLPMDAAEITAPKELELGDCRIMYKGYSLEPKECKLNGYYYGYYTMDAFTSADDPGLITLRFTESLHTGDRIEIRHGQGDDRIIEFYSNGGMSVWNGQLQSSGKQDYLIMEVIYADKDRIRYTIDGSFNDGDTTITGEFYLATP